jgi:hypothetical protein
MAGEVNWNILNPNTPQIVAGSFAQGAANRLANQQAQQEQAMNALRLKREQQAMTDEETMRNLYAQSGGDVEKVASGLEKAGMYQPAMKIRSDMAAQKKAQIEEALQKMEVVGRLTAGVQDQNSYNAARQQLAAIYGPQAAASIPDVYDPAAVKRFQMQALGVKDQLEQQWKALDFGLRQQQFGFERQKFGAQQGLEREKMRQSAAQFAESKNLEREKMAQSGGTAAGLAKIRDAQDALMIIGEAEKILNKGKATGSYAGKAADIIAGGIGYSTQGAREAASLKALSGALVAKMPKMSGPQSDKDVQLYREMAGQIGDDTLPIATRKAAIRTVKNLQEKYAGNESAPSAIFGGWSVVEH